MDKTILIGLSGQTERFQLDEDAYERLTRYLDRAASRLQDDPDRTRSWTTSSGRSGQARGPLGADDRLSPSPTSTASSSRSGRSTPDASRRRRGRRRATGRRRLRVQRASRSPACAPASPPTPRSRSTGCARSSSSGPSSRPASSGSSTSRMAFILPVAATREGRLPSSDRDRVCLPPRGSSSVGRAAAFQVSPCRALCSGLRIPARIGRNWLSLALCVTAQ